LSSGEKFYKNISYSKYKEDVFDIFLPNSKQPSALVLYIHGGGFISGDKNIPYKGDGRLISQLLLKNIAFASVNYRFVSDDGMGIFKCMNDSKRALQFIRFHSKIFNIDKNNVVLMGGSAGAGTSLWIGLSDEMADKKNPDPILRESTRVKGLVLKETQANYDILSWPETVYQEYKDVDQKFIINLASEEEILRFYGLKTIDNINSEAVNKYRSKFNMLNLLSSDDPEIYAENIVRPYVKPVNRGVLLHHPAHIKALMDKANEMHVKGEFYAPKMNIDTRGGENREDFIYRVLHKNFISEK
jgi:hypothetical protein